MGTEQTTATTSADSLASAGQSVATDADSQAADAVGTLTLVQRARLSSQNRAVNAAVSAYGKNSTQAVAARQAVTVTQSAHARLGVLQAKVSVAQPTVPSGGWVLHGHVFDATFKPQQRYTVFLVDAQKNYLNQYGFSYTDSSGYFLVANDPNAAPTTAPSSAPVPAATAAPPADAEAGVARTSKKKSSRTSPAPATSASGASSAPPSASASSATPEIFIQVADANGNPVLLSQTAFTPVTGQAVYQALTLPAGGSTLGDPPAEIRNVAFPAADGNQSNPKGK